MKPTLLVALLALVMLAMTSCSSTTYGPIDEKTPGATYEKGVPGGTVVETRKLTATVTALDATTREVTLTGPDGKKTTVKCGPEILNFDQVHVGDMVKATVTVELAVAMANTAEGLTNSSATTVTYAAKGAKPGIHVAATQQYTATITAINLKRHEATLLFPDGSLRTFVVRKDVDLSRRKVGELVVFRVAMATAISLEKP